MNILNRIFKCIIFISFCGLLSVSCKQELEQNKSDKTAYITIDNNFARTVNPVLELEKMTNIVLKGTFSNQEEILGEWKNYNDVTKAITAIIPGVWSFTLTAQQGGMAFCGKIDGQEIVLGANKLKFDLELQSIDLQEGTGSIHIPFIVTNSSDNITNDSQFYYDCTLRTLNGNRVKSYVNIKFVLNSTVDSGFSKIPAGTYFIEYVFFRKFIPSSSTEYIDGELGTYRELINVTADCTSSKELTYIDIAKLYTISYELGDGRFDDITPYSYSYWKEAVKLNEPIKKDYYFDGWYTNPDFSGKPVTEIPARSYGNKVFYAKWIPEIVTYKVNYYKYYYYTYGDGSYSSYFQTDKVGYAYFDGRRDDFYDVSIMPKTYYDRNGEKRDFDYCFRGYTAKEIEPVKITSDTQVDVYYDPNTVTVTFDFDGGKKYGKDVITYTGKVNHKISGLEPEKEGYSFLGFEDEEDTLYTGYYPSVDKTYKAKYSSLSSGLGEFKRYDYFQDSDIRLYGDPTKSSENGAFTITQSPGDGCFSSASSTNKITLPRFYIAKTELTKEDWYKVFLWATDDARGEKKYSFAENYRYDLKTSTSLLTSKKPMAAIPYNDAVLWCNAASEMYGFEPYYIIEKDSSGDFRVTYNSSSKGYRLPSEMEWEFAARSGYSVFVLKKNTECWKGSYPGDPLKDVFYFISGSSIIDEVGSFEPNSDGLYNMCGNVGEFCDMYSESEKYLSFCIRSGFIAGPNDTLEQCEKLKKSNYLRFSWPGSSEEEGYSDRVGLRLARSF